MNQLVFVYGSLKKGYGNHPILGNSEFIGKAKTYLEFQMYSFGGFPALVSGDKSYEGEIYSVDEDTMVRLDRLEGYPHFYTRKEHNVIINDEDNPLVWIYTLADESEAEALPIVERSSW